MRWLLVALVAVTVLAQESPVEQAIAALERNDFSAAIPLLQAAAETEPENESIHFNLGLALSQLGQDDEAVDAYLRALEIKPELPQAFLNVGVLLVRVDRAAEAVPHLAKAVEHRPNDPRSLYFYGHALSATSKTEEAIPIYERAAALDPQEPSIWIELGQAQAQRDRFDEAAASYRRAAEIDPELRSYELQLAEQVELSGGKEQALELYRAYLAGHTSHIAVQERIGMLLLELERYEEAALQLEQVVEASPTDAARMALAHAYASANDAEAARTKWAEAVAANPLDPSLRVPYAASLIQAFEYEAAGEQYVAALKLDDQNATAWAGLAFALHQVKNYPASLDALINSNALEPLNAGSLFLRAITEDRLQLFAEAKVSYEAFLAADSGLDKEEWQARQRLRAVEWALERR